MAFVGTGRALLTSRAQTSREALWAALNDGATVANYQPGVGVTGTLTATAWANQIGAAGAADGTGHAPIYLSFTGQKYGFTPGVNGNYFSSPDAAANRIVGDIDIDVTLSDNDPTVSQVYASKASASGAGQAWFFEHIGSTQLRLAYSLDGTILLTADSTANPTIDAGVTTNVRVKRIATTGVVTFYTSADFGASFTQLGNTVAGTSGALSAGTKQLEVGTYSSGTTVGGGDPVRYYRARIYNGDRAAGGTLVVDFNPSDWSETFTNGATATSTSTGEVWTLNNTAIANPAAIIGSPFIVTDQVATYLRASYTSTQPRTIYLVGMQPIWTAGKYILDGVTANTLGLSKTTATPSVSINAGAAVAENAGLTLRAKHILTIGLNGASSYTAVDSVADVTGNAGAGNPGGLTMGADGGVPTAGTFGAYWYSEVIDRAVADGAGTRATIVSYLKAIHGTV